NQDVLYVGDTETDMKCANDFECDCALITRRRDMQDLIDEHEPKYVFNDYSEMMELLGISNKKTEQKKAC
ncbi:MAG: HAD hydrolase-like protein, partial [Pseudomonadota bacterium]